MYNVQEAEFWKQRVDRENLFAAYRNFAGYVPPSESGSSRSSRTGRTGMSRASTATRNKIDSLEKMLLEERSKREEIEKKLQSLLEETPQDAPPPTK